VKLVKIAMTSEVAGGSRRRNLGRKTAYLLDISNETVILDLSHLPLSYHYHGRSVVVPRSVLEAIRMGIWDFEPPEVAFSKFDPSNAMPGTHEKLRLLAERVQKGLPLWHTNDRDDVESPPPVLLRRRPR
jgi:hypothetical protein